VRGDRSGAKTVNVVASAAQSAQSKLAAKALRFFLDDDRRSAAGDVDDDDDAPRHAKLESVAARHTEMKRQNNNYRKKSRNRERRLERSIKQLARKEYAKCVARPMCRMLIVDIYLCIYIARAHCRQRLNEPDPDRRVNFPAIALIDDPQSFAERLFAVLRRVREP
jgi:hypothetical protein